MVPFELPVIRFPRLSSVTHARRKRHCGFDSLFNKDAFSLIEVKRTRDIDANRRGFGLRLGCGLSQAGLPFFPFAKREQGYRAGRPCSHRVGG